MKIINDTPYQMEALPMDGPGNQTVVAVIVKATFMVSPIGRVISEVEQIPLVWGDELFDDEKSVKFESDIVVFKPRADIVLVGSAHGPGGRMVQFIDVSVRVGRKQKILRVFGDRKWDFSSLFNSGRITEAQPFSTMELTYDKAFGGIDMDFGGWCEENPTGKGFISKKDKKSNDGVPLPNIEDPRHLIKEWSDHPTPVGFAFYNKAVMPRKKYMGTFDEQWRKERSPKMPKDFRYDFYNGAHPDLQVEGYLQGNEEVELIHLTPAKTLSFHLPNVTLDCMATHLGENGKSGVQTEVSMNLDTLCLIPDEKKFYMVWRGNHPVKDLAASDLESVRVSEGV